MNELKRKILVRCRNPSKVILKEIPRTKSVQSGLSEDRISQKIPSSSPLKSSNLKDQKAAMIKQQSSSEDRTSQLSYLDDEYEDAVEVKISRIL